MECRLMKKRKVAIAVAIIVFLVLFVLPLNITLVTDGGTKIFRPIVSEWYVILKYKKMTIKEPVLAHDDPNYHRPEISYIKGTTVIVFGKVIYNDMYDAP